MAFGNPLNNFTIVADGASGNIIAIDLSSTRMKKITQIQLKSTAGVYSVPVTSPVALDALHALLTASSATKIAFAQTSRFLYVYLNATSYPINATNRIGIYYFRNPTPVVGTSDKLDIPEEARGLLKAIIMRGVKQDGQSRMELGVTQEVVRQKNILGLTE